jgi:hypothetical protein
MDLGSGTYNGWTGGLYPNGSNYMPAAHKSAGLYMSSQVQPLDTAGSLDVTGKIVWLSIGFSNATQEASTFIPLANALPNKNPKLTLIDGAVGGQTAQILSTPSNSSYATYWSTVASRLANNGVTSKQVQVIWFKDDNIAGSTPIDTHSDSLYVQTKRIMNELKTRFPNVKLCYIASRIYAGYASSTLNPEPYAYRNGWTMKKIIESQINGDPQLAYTGVTAKSPWLAWGSYLWADGTNPRSDGLTWICPDDYATDGTHPSTIGRQKVANILLNFFKTDSTTCPWFLNNCGIVNNIADHEAVPALEIYPNPTTGLTIIHSNHSLKNATIHLYNSFGQLIVADKCSNVDYRFDLGDRPGGLYYLAVSEAGKKPFTQIVVKR